MTQVHVVQVPEEDGLPTIYVFETKALADEFMARFLERTKDGGDWYAPEYIDLPVITEGAADAADDWWQIDEPDPRGTGPDRYPEA